MGGAAKNRSHARDQFTDVEWLSKTIVRTEFQRQNPVVLVGECSEHHNRCTRYLPQAPQELEAVHLRHHHVRDQEIERAPCDTSQSGCSARDVRGLETLLGQKFNQRASVANIVIYKKDSA